MWKADWGRRLRTAAVPALLCAVAPPAAWASSFQVNPVQLNVQADKGSVVMSVTNSGDAPVSVRVKTFAWTQTNGEDATEPTTELLVSPPMATIAAGTTQLVRIGPRARSKGPERAYRVVLEEIPTASSGRNAVNMALRLDMPLYIATAERAKGDLEWHAWRSDNGRIVVEAANSGPSRVELTELRWGAGGEERLALFGRSGVVLAGGRKRWTLSERSALAAGAPLNLQVRTTRGERQALLTLQPE